MKKTVLFILLISTFVSARDINLPWNLKMKQLVLNSFSEVDYKYRQCILDMLLDKYPTVIDYTDAITDKSWFDYRNNVILPACVKKLNK